MSKNDIALFKQQKRTEFEDRLKDYVFRLDYLEKKGAVSKSDYQRVFNQLQESKVALDQVLNDQFDERILQIAIEGILKNLEYSLEKDIKGILSRQPLETVSAYYFDVAEYRLQKTLNSLKNLGKLSDAAIYRVQGFMQGIRQYFFKHQLAKSKLSRDEIESVAREYESNVSNFIREQ